MKLSIFVCALCFAVQLASSDTSTNAQVSDNRNVTTEASVNKTSILLQKWKNSGKQVEKLVAKMVKSLLPQVLRMSEEIQLSGNCSRSMMKFITGLRQMKFWAFRMLDSSGKIPNGVFSGSINTFGDYDLCVDTVVPGSFKGQYCLLEINPPLPERKRFVNYDNEIPEFINFTKPDTVLAKFMRLGMFYYHLNFRTSICVPSTCTKDEMQGIASKMMELSGIEFEALIPNCEIKNDKIVFSETEIGIMAVLSFLVFLATAATITDVCLKLLSKEEPYQKNLSVPVQCLLCFSFYTNFKKLMRSDNNPESIRIFHGMKAITILWVMLSHNYFYQNFQALSMLMEARAKGQEFFFQLISNGVLSVETFFFISAVLVSYGVTKLKGKKLNVFLFAFRRLWRLTPPYMLVIGCVILLPYLGSGPVWRETVIDGLTEKCKRYWWTNLLYFNNFLPFAEMCLNWTWYIPVDTHLYFLSLLVLIPLQKNPRMAFIINGVLCLTGITITAAFHVHYQLNPIAIYVFMHPDDINYFIDRGYFRTYLHLATYCTGLCVGYVLATKKQFRIPLAVNIFGWLVSFAVGLTVAFGVYDWNQGTVPSMAVSALFACTNKFAWSLALAWVTITCMTGNGGIATTILSWNGFVPLSRLTYMTYLVHPLIHFTYMGSTRTLIGAEHRTLIHQYFGTVVKSFLLACFLSLLFETPFMALEKVFISRRHNTEINEKIHERKRKDNSANFEPPPLHNGSSLKKKIDVYAVDFRKFDIDN